MTLRIARLVLTLAISLISGFVLYPCTSGPSASKVSIDVTHVYDESGTGHVDCLWRIKLVLGGRPVKPNRCATDTDFAMHRLAGGIPLNASGFETERLNEKVVSRRDVAINQHGDEPFKGWHEAFSVRLPNRLALSGRR